MLGPTFNLTAVLALIAAALLLASGHLHLHLDRDSGLVAASLLGGAGWFGRELYQDTRRRRAVWQAYAAVIETTLIGFRGTLNDTQLTRYPAMARAVQEKTEPPSIRGEVTDPATLLPDLRAEVTCWPRKRSASPPNGSSARAASMKPTSSWAPPNSAPTARIV